MSRRTLSREHYTIGIICALEMERRAVHATLDEEHGMVRRTTGDDNDYVFGRIGTHNVVVACPPVGVVNKLPAATVARDMMHSFPIKCSLMVGVGGGVWSERTDIRLGDVVVSEPNRMHGGVVEWNHDNMKRDGMWRFGTLNKPPWPLLDVVQSLKARHMLEDGEVGANLEVMFAKYPQLRDKYRYQGQEHDELFDAGYTHAGGDTCADCDRSRIVQDRPHRTDEGPRIHYGNIASSTEVVGYGWTRDRIAQEEGILCFETEAAGLMDTFPCVVIRGVCDYADTHKNTRWEGYAAAVAAAYAKELLLWMSATDVARMSPASEVTGISGNIESRSEPPIID
jgi:nucleoside phosphorylase